MKENYIDTKTKKNDDNSFADLYIDGKMVKSAKLDGIQSDATDAKIYLGGNQASLNDIN